jgi:myo-inositol-1(or 4)-monophosphatase
MSEVNLDEVRSWAAQAGNIAMKHFHSLEVRRKADQSVVTQADEEIEQFLTERIGATYPEHGIIGEEHTRQGLQRPFVWAIDPVDGTSAFVAGLALWGVSLGLLHARQPYAGVIHLPIMGDTYWAAPGANALMNGERIQVVEDRAWDSEDWIGIPSDAHHTFYIDFPGKTRALGSTIAQFAYVARGSAVGAVVSGVSIWDIAAVMPLLSAAGGVAITLDGQPLDIAPLLEGKRRTETFIIAGPTHAERLLRYIHER